MTLVVKDITRKLLTHPEYDNHEVVYSAFDKETGYDGVIAIHNRNRGPALGGCRYWAGYSLENGDDPVTDALRLSRGMTYKNVAADLRLGGGKSVIAGQEKQAPPQVLISHFKAVEEVRRREAAQGKPAYVIAEDVGTSVEAMLMARGLTTAVCGLPMQAIAAHLIPDNIAREDIPGADPSFYTAYGVYTGILAAARFLELDHGHLEGLKVTVKGYGNVSRFLCDMLQKEGARLVISEINERRHQEIIEKYGKESLLPPDEEIMAQEADIYAPCALGADLNDKTIPLLEQAGVRLVAGCANNQLQKPNHAESLAKAGITYIPDYILNSGGVMSAGIQYLWLENPASQTFPSHEKIMARIRHIGENVTSILERAGRENKNTDIIASRICEEGFKARSSVKAAA